MRSEGSSLDLNNLPEDYIRDGKQVADDNSNGHRKKKSGNKEGKDESGKVYECRFCSLKFCKSQALGGHMNRHRQERETETLNRARQLVFSNDNLAAQPSPHLGCCHSLTPGSYHSTATAIGSDPTLPLRFPTRMFPPSSSSTLLPPQPHPVPPPPPPPQPHQPYLYTSSSRPSPFPPYYPTQHPLNEYYVGHVFGNASQCSHPSIDSNNYTCIGAPVGHAASFSGGTNRVSDTSTGGGRDGTTLQGNEEEGVNWGRSAYAGTQQRMDVGSSINRFQDGF